MTMTALPTAPSRNDPATFADRGDALMAALPGFVTEANALEANVVAKEASATASAAAAFISETAAVGASNAAAWVSAGNYLVGNVRYSLVTYQSFRCKLAHSGITTDPNSDPTRWVQLSTVPIQTGHTGKALVTDGTNATWQTLPEIPGSSIITVNAATYTALNNKVHVLTYSGIVTISLPSAPTAGNIVWVVIANGLFTNVIARNGSTIMGIAEDLIIDSTITSINLQFINSTWRII